MAAGFAITAISLGWPLGTAIGGRLIPYIHPRKIAMLGACLLTGGTVPLVLLTEQTPFAFLLSALFLIGLGFGLCTTMCTVALLSAVNPELRGVTMSTNLLLSSLSQTVFVVVFGAVYNAASSGGGEVGMTKGVNAVFACAVVLAVISLGLTSQLQKAFGKHKDTGAAM